METPEPVDLTVRAVMVGNEMHVGVFIDGELTLSSPPDGARALGVTLIRCADSLDGLAARGIGGRVRPPV